MASKVPIPRLKSSATDDGSSRTTRSESIHRVSRACEACRCRKIRCNGGTPRCHNCLDNAQACAYSEGRKDRLKRATKLNEDMASFLKNIRNRVTPNENRQIDDFLERVMDASSDGASSSKRTPSIPPPVPNVEDRSNEIRSFTQIDVGERLDKLHHDMLRNEARATGYVGKNTATHWLRWLQQELIAEEDIRSAQGSEIPLGHPGTPSPDQTTWSRPQGPLSAPALINISTLYPEDVDIGLDALDPFELPPLDTAEKLIACYLDTVHESFPILSREAFISQFDQYILSIKQRNPLPVEERWQAMLNLVFAIAANYSGAVEAKLLVGEQDDYYFHARARALAQEFPRDPPDIQDIQNGALLALYYLVVGRASRAWIVIGISVRLAYSLGLHLRNVDPTVTVAHKESLKQLWWGLYSLERTLSTVTGRPSAIIDDYCSVPLPTRPVSQWAPQEGSPIQQGQRYGKQGIRPNASCGDPASSRSSLSTSYGTAATFDIASYLANTIQIGRIAQQAIVELYCPRKSMNQRVEMQQTIMSLSKQLVAWATSQPTEATCIRPNSEPDMKRQLIGLTLYYNSTKILVTRPCLTRLDPSQSSEAAEFQKQMARECVNAAKVIVDLLSDDVNTLYLYQHGPWWSIDHHLMQALAVLLLAFFYGPEITSHPIDVTLQTTRKLMRWLREMKKKNQMANREYSMAFRILQQLASRLDIDISGLIGEEMSIGPVPSTPYSEIESTSGQVEGDSGRCGLNDTGWTPTLQGDLQMDPDGNLWDSMHFPQTYQNPFVTVHDNENPLQLALAEQYLSPEGFIHPSRE